MIQASDFLEITVVIKNLEGRTARYNGKIGKVVDFNKKRRRFSVQLDDGGVQLHPKPGNMEIAAPEIKYERRWIDTKGCFGLVATKPISKGEVVSREAPTITITRDEVPEIFQSCDTYEARCKHKFIEKERKLVEAKFESLDDEKKSNVMLNYDSTGWFFGDGQQLGGIFGRWLSGYLDFGRFRCLCTQKVKVNHSCCPNLTHQVDGAEVHDREEFFDVIHASRDIAAGEELVRAYQDPAKPSNVRALANVMGFECRCDHCLRCEKDSEFAQRSDLNRSVLQDFYARFEQEDTTAAFGATTLDDVKHLWALHDEEGIHNSRDVLCEVGARIAEQTFHQHTGTHLEVQALTDCVYWRYRVFVAKYLRFGLWSEEVQDALSLFRDAERQLKHAVLAESATGELERPCKQVRLAANECSAADSCSTADTARESA